VAGDGQIGSGSGLSSLSERCVIMLIQAGVIHAISKQQNVFSLPRNARI